MGHVALEPLRSHLVEICGVLRVVEAAHVEWQAASFTCHTRATKVSRTGHQEWQWVTRATAHLEGPLTRLRRRDDGDHHQTRQPRYGASCCWLIMPQLAHHQPGDATNHQRMDAETDVQKGCHAEASGGGARARFEAGFFVNDRSWRAPWSPRQHGPTRPYRSRP